MKSNMLDKLMSRKLWLAIAATIASIAAGLSGIADPNVCAVLVVASTAIYTFCEAYVDGQSAKASTSAVVVEAKTGDRDTVQAFLGQKEGE